MNEEKKKTLPGVTLHHRGTRRYQVGPAKKAELLLECTIDDEQVWEHAEKLFTQKGGYRIYTIEDFKSEVSRVLAEEVAQLETRVTDLQFDNERLEREKRHMNEELAKYREMLSGFGKSLGG